MISIVITSYGEETWRSLAWERAYPSAIAQDNGTEKFEVIVHHSELETIGPARNEAAAKAEGKWLIFLDADDELEPRYVHEMSIAAAKTSGDVLMQPAVRYLRKGGRSGTRPVIIPDRNLRHDNYLVIGTMLRRELFQRVEGFNDYHHGFEDWSLWAKCWKLGAQVVPVPRAIYCAHYNPQSKHRLLWRDRREQVKLHERIEKELFE